MRKVKSIIVLLVAFTLMASMFVGCGATTSNEPEKSSAATATTADTTASETSEVNSGIPKDPIEISIALWDIGRSLPEGVDDKVYNTLKEKLNITIKPVNTTWDDYEQKIQIWAASQQLPDVFAIDARKKEFYNTWVKEGVIRSLPDDINKYPSLQKLFEQPSVIANKDPDGKYYCIPRPDKRTAGNQAIEKGIKVRKDWMANLGITKDPENADEFITLMKAFANDDPDQNGQNDTVGLTARDAGFMVENLSTSICPELKTGWIKEDGKWIPGFMTKKAIPALKEFKKIYDSGAMDKDIAIIKGDEGEDKFFGDKAGALAHNAYLTAAEADKWDKTHPGKLYSDSVKLLFPWKALDGNTYRHESDSVWSESYFRADIDDAKMDRILMLYDFMLSDEGLMLYHYGIEGIDYKMNGDQIEITREKDEKGLYKRIASVYPICDQFWFLATWDAEFVSMEDITIEPGVRTMVQDYLDQNLKRAIAVPTNYSLDYLPIASRDKMVADYGEDVTKAIVSKDVEKTWNEIIANYMKNGYDKIIQEMNEAAAKAGIE